jgi:hypothetical protein
MQAATMRRRWMTLILGTIAGVTSMAAPLPVEADCGDTWTISHDGTFSTFWEDVAIGDATHAWAVGHDWTDRMMIAAWNGSDWETVTPEILPTGISNLYGVWADAADDAWAVGSYYDGDPDTSRALILRWDGASWTQEPAPNGRTVRLESVWGDGAGDLWAAGVEDVGGRYVGFVIRRVGGAWERVRFPRHDGHAVLLLGISGSGTDDIWTVGGDRYIDSSIEHPVAFHWAGSSWDRVKTAPIPAFSASFSGVSVVDGTHAWAVGTQSDDDRMLIERWDGTAWQQEQIPDHSGLESLEGVAASSSTSAYAVGYRNGHPLIERWDGALWDNVRPPWRRGNFTNVDHVTGLGALAVGSHYNHDAIATTCA